MIFLDFKSDSDNYSCRFYISVDAYFGLPRLKLRHYSTSYENAITRMTAVRVLVSQASICISAHPHSMHSNFCQTQARCCTRCRTREEVARVHLVLLVEI